MIERHVRLGSDEGAIALRSVPEQSIWVTGELGDTALMSDPDGVDGELWLLPADQWGPFDVTTRMLEGHPGPPDESWEDVVEFSVTTEGAVVVTEVVNNDPTAEWIDEPGKWRTGSALVAVRNLTRLPSQSRANRPPWSGGCSKPGPPRRTRRPSDRW